LEKDQLKEVIRELKSRSDLSAVRHRTQALLRSVDPKVLSLAEQELLQEGFSQDELRKLCDIHLEPLLGNIDGKAENNPTHPVTILQEEHKAIQAYLSDLERITNKLGTEANVKPSQNDVAELRTISQMLVEAESHHKREEVALFPRLEQHGVTGPPAIMRLEHDELRKRKKALKEVVEAADKLSQEEFDRQLKHLADYIVPTLRSHIFKEDNVLYPTALRTLSESEWPSMRSEFDKIGYCPFTPKHVLVRNQ